MNIFNSLLTFKNKIDDALIRQSDSLASIAQDGSESLDLEFSGLMGKVYQIAGNVTQGYAFREVISENGNATLLTEVTFDDLSKLRSDPVVQNAIADNARCSDFNVAVSAITGSFLSTTKVSVNDIINILNTYSVNGGSEVKDLVSSVINVSEDGLITQAQWMSILASMLEGVREGERNSTFELDTTNPFTFQSVFGLVMQAVSVLSSVLAIVFRSLTGFFSGITAAVSALFTYLFNPGVIGDDLSLDSDSPNTYLRGPLLAYNTADADLPWYGIPDSYTPVHLADSGAYDFYVWTDGNKHFLANGYLKAEYDLDAVISLLIDHQTSRYHSSLVSDFQYFKFKWTPFTKEELDACALSADQAFVLPYDARSLSRSYVASILVAIMSSMNQYSAAHPDAYFGESIYAPSPARDIHTFLYYVFSTGSIIEWTGVNSQTIFIRDYVLRAFNDRENVYYDGDLDKLVQAKSDGYFIPGLQHPVFAFCKYASSSPLPYVQLEFYDAVGRPLGTWHDLDEVPAPPRRWLGTVPDFDVSQVMALLITIAGVVAATVVGGAKLTRAVKKRKLRNQLARQQNLEELRSNFSANPSPRNLALYTDAIRDYNFKAKVFGWNTYDPLNQWFDAPNSPSGQSGSASVGTTVAALPTIYDVLISIKGHE